MGVVSDAAVSRGDLARRVADLEEQVRQLRTARRLEAAAVGRGGTRIHSGGGLTVEGGGGVLVGDGGDVNVQGGGDVLVGSGGALTARGGTLLAEDLAGDDIFRVTTDPASIFMRQELISDLVEAIVAELLVSPAGQDLAAFVIGQRAHAAVVATDQATTSTSFTDLATVGPTVANVPISSSGKAVVWVGAHSFATSQTATSSQFGVMSFEVSGATSRAPSNDRAFTLGYVDVDELSAVDATATTAVLLTGLNEGLHTFTAKYRSINGDSYHWENRTLVVLAL